MPDRLSDAEFELICNTAGQTRLVIAEAWRARREEARLLLQLKASTAEWEAGMRDAESVEREQCAKLAECCGDPGRKTFNAVAHKIARRIRARGQT